MRKPVIVLALLLLAAPGVQAQTAPLPGPLAQFAESLTEPPRDPSILRGRVYVPAHSSLLIGGGKTRLNLSVTLSIHCKKPCPLYPRMRTSGLFFSV